jgi:hypothetical protein
MRFLDAKGKERKEKSFSGYLTFYFSAAVSMVKINNRKKLLCTKKYIKIF